MNYINKIVLRLIGVMFILSLTVPAFSQEIVITGIVKDERGLPLIGAAIIEVSDDNRMLNGTQTNIDGVFRLQCQSSTPTLSASFLGYTETLVTVKNDDMKINIVLKAESQSLDIVTIKAQKAELVDMGYISFDKRQASGAVSVVDINEVGASHSSDVGEMLQGQASGLMITSNSGDPGAGVSIKIRGSASLNANSNPLIVIDGIPTEVDGSFDNIEDFQDYSRSPLSDISPDDIKNITVLKDASTTALYGSRGANGVILITTKRGRKGVTNINLSSKLSTLPEPVFLPRLSGDELKTLWLEMDQNANSLTPYGSSSSISYPELRDDITRDDYEYFNNNTDWADHLTKDGFAQDYSLSFNGGGDAVRFSMIGNYVNQEGTQIGTSYDKYNTSFKLDYTLSDKVQFSGNVYYTHQEWEQTKGFKYGNNTLFDSPLSVALRRPSFLPAYSPENPGEYSFFYWSQEQNGRNINPIAQATNADANKLNDQVRANISVNVNLLKGLKLRSYVAYSMRNTSFDKFFPYDAVSRVSADGTPYLSWTNTLVNSLYERREAAQSITQESVLSYSKTLNEKHTFTLNAVEKIVSNNSSYYTQTASNTGSDDLKHVNASNKWIDQTAVESTSANISFIGMVNYSYDDRYSINAAINTNGSSAFGPEYRWGLFPSLGGWWRISNESFLESASWLNDLKFRASWGQSGAAPSGSYLHLSTYNRGLNGYNGQDYVIPGSTQLQELRWESTQTTDFGIEMSAFDNRISGEIGYYIKNVNDMLVKRTQPASSGISDSGNSIMKNFGDMTNHGFEATLNLDVIQKKNFSWDLKMNLATQTSVITSWPTETTQWSQAGSESQPIKSSGADDYAFYSTVREGDPLGAFYGYQVDKNMPIYVADENAVVFGQNGQVVNDFDGEPLQKYNSYSRKFFKGGDVNYVDQNNDGIINDLDIVRLGDANPDMFGGITNTFRYKAFTLRIFCNYVVGNDILNFVRYEGELLTTPTNYSTSVLRRWRKPGDVTDIPKAVRNTTSYNNELGGDKYVEDGSFLRLQSVAFSYNVPRNFLSKYNMKSANFTLSAYNLGIITNYTGVDPEVSHAAKAFQIGIDRATTPKQASYTLMLKLGF